MNTKKQFEVLMEDVHQTTARFMSAARRHHVAGIVTRVSPVLLGALIPVLLSWQGLSVEGQAMTKNITLALGAIITVIGAFDAFSEPRLLWIRDTATVRRLQDFHRDLEVYGAGRDVEEFESEKMEAFRRELRVLLDAHTDSWSKQFHADELFRTGRILSDATKPKAPGKPTHGHH
jgi:hypothetical protein